MLSSKFLVSFELKYSHRTLSVLLLGVKISLCVTGIPIGCCPLMFVEWTAFGKRLLGIVWKYSLYREYTWLSLPVVKDWKKLSPCSSQLSFSASNLFNSIFLLKINYTIVLEASSTTGHFYKHLTIHYTQ